MAQAAKEKPGLIAKLKKSVRDMRGELKRVVWPSKKQTINNTGIVLMFMAIMAIIIGLFDTGLTSLIRLFLGV
ncbi:MAG: preprotein translocase subunit SecE [Oscillospiraceae bacterium]|nr:preprotein translocase subunit SecE [Oscillospiraceae bacterium]